MPNPVELLSPSSVHLLALLVGFTVFAFRTRACAYRWRYVLLMATAWCWLAATPVFVNWLALELENDYPPIAADDLPEDAAVIVLAAGPSYETSLPDGLQLNLASYRRALAGAEVWRRTGGTLIFTGTTRVHEKRAVAARMAVLAMQFGVPAEAIRIEDRARNTYENLYNVRAMVAPGRQVIIVTSAMHMPRAMAVAEALGIEAIAAPADFRAKREMRWRAWLPDSGTRPFLVMVLHEWLGRAWYAVRGWS